MIMLNELIMKIEQDMLKLLNNEQLEQLHNVLLKNLSGLNINESNEKVVGNLEKDYCEIFICAKEVEGCSKKSIKYYKLTIKNMLDTLSKPVKHITTEDLRTYLSDYYKKGNCSKVTIDNIRRILSSFFV